MFADEADKLKNVRQKRHLQELIIFSQVGKWIELPPIPFSP